MSKEKPYFDLPSDEKDQKIVAALLTNAVINRLSKNSSTTQGALEKVAEVYNCILNTPDSLADWKKLGG